MQDEWHWNLRSFYGKNAMRPGHVAFETAHSTQEARDDRIAAWKARQDIGCIESREINGHDAWEVVWHES